MDSSKKHRHSTQILPGNSICDSSHILPVAEPLQHDYPEVNQLLQNYALFHEGGNIRFVDQGHGALIAAVREGRKTPEEKFLLVSNLDIAHPHKIKLELSGIRQKNRNCLLREMIHDGKIFLEAICSMR